MHITLHLDNIQAVRKLKKSGDGILICKFPELKNVAKVSKNVSPAFRDMVLRRHKQQESEDLYMLNGP
jgi:hypothetical protein